MSKFVSFVVKHDKAILNSTTAAFLIPMVVLAFVDMDNMLAVVGLLVGYVLTMSVFLYLIGLDIRRDYRKTVASNRAASEQNRKPV